MEAAFIDLFSIQFNLVNFDNMEGKKIITDHHKREIKNITDEQALMGSYLFRYHSVNSFLIPIN